MGIAASLRRVTAPVASALNAKLETLFRHVTNEAQQTRESLGARIDGLLNETHRVHDRMYQVVDPAMTTVAEASTLLQHAALRVERRLAELGDAVGSPPPSASQLAGSRAAVEVPFALAALGRATPGGPVVLVGWLPELAVYTAGAGHPTTLVGGPSTPPPPKQPPTRAAALEDAATGESAVGEAGPAAVVMFACRGPLTTDDQLRLEVATEWLSPGGRLVVAAPVVGASADTSLQPCLGVLADAGWAVTHQATAAKVDGAWTAGTPAEATADRLVLVELARAAIAG